MLFALLGLDLSRGVEEVGISADPAPFTKWALIEVWKYPELSYRRSGSWINCGVDSPFFFSRQ